jgi:hypothetical protein
LITRTIFGEQYRSLNSSLCTFLYSPVNYLYKVLVIVVRPYVKFNCIDKLYCHIRVPTVLPYHCNNCIAISLYNLYCHITVPTVTPYHCTNCIAISLYQLYCHITVPTVSPYHCTNCIAISLHQLYCHITVPILLPYLCTNCIAISLYQFMNSSSSVLKLLYSDRRTDSYDIAQCAVFAIYRCESIKNSENVPCSTADNSELWGGMSIVLQVHIWLSYCR